MSTDLSALLSGQNVGYSQGDTRGSARLQKRFNIAAGVVSANFQVPWDTKNLDAMAIFSTIGSAATNTRFKVLVSGVAAIEMVAGSASIARVYSTASAALLLDPSQPAGSQNPISMVIRSSASTDAALVGGFLLTYTRNNGEL